MGSVANTQTVGSGMEPAVILNTQKTWLGSELIELGVKEIPMLFEDLIPLVGVWAIVGASDTCKSMILRQLAMSVAGQKPFLNRAYKGKYGNVIVICSEDDQFAISYLLGKQNKSMGLTKDELDNMRFIFDTMDVVKRLTEELEKQPADLVIVDALGDVFTGKDMNQVNHVRTFLGGFTSLCVNYNCSVCFLHHTGKRTEELMPSKNNSIGSQGVEAKMRLLIELRQDRTEKDLRHFCIVKGNYIPAECKESSYVLKMDENLVFTDTGNRVDFEQLALKDSNGKKNDNPKTPYEIEDNIHKAFIISEYSNMDMHSQRNLTERVINRFGVSDRNARLFVKFYEDRKWITNKSKTASRKEFYSNVTGMSSMFD